MGFFKTGFSLSGSRISTRPHFLLALFLALVFVFSLTRLKYELHWSAWATGDAQNLIAASHFAREGFSRHYFLPYFHPGYLGISHGSESPLGYYTNYPPLSVIILGLQMKIFGNNLNVFRTISILVSLTGLIIWYLILKKFFNPVVGLLAVMFMGSSIAFLSHIDGLTPYTLDEFLASGALLFFLKYNGPEEKRLRNPVFLTFCCVFVFFSAFNSFDYILYLQVFFTGYFILNRDKILLRTIILLAAMPVLSFLLHLYQNAFVFGGFGPAFNDITGMFFQRSSTFAPGFIVPGLKHISYALHYLFSYKPYDVLLLALLVCPALIIDYRRHIKAAKTLLLFFVSSSLWAAIAFRQFYSFAIVMGKIYLSFLALLFALCIYYSSKHWLGRKTPASLIAFILILIIAVYPPALNFKKYLSLYPNNIDRRFFWGFQQETGKISRAIELSRNIGNLTAHGDIVIVHDDFLFSTEQVNPLFEYYSDRRLEFCGNSFVQFKSRLKKILEYRNSRFVNRKNRVYLLLDNEKKELIEDLIKKGLINKNIKNRLGEGNYVLLKIT